MIEGYIGIDNGYIADAVKNLLDEITWVGEPTFDTLVIVSNDFGEVCVEIGDWGFPTPKGLSVEAQIAFVVGVVTGYLAEDLADDDADDDDDFAG